MGLFFSTGKWNTFCSLIFLGATFLSCYIASIFFVRYIEVYKWDFDSDIVYTFFIINIYLTELCCIFGRALFQLGFNNSQNNDNLLTLLVTCHINRSAFEAKFLTLLKLHCTSHFPAVRNLTASKDQQSNSIRSHFV